LCRRVSFEFFLTTIFFRRTGKLLTQNRLGPPWFQKNADVRERRFRLPPRLPHLDERGGRRKLSSGRPLYFAGPVPAGVTSAAFIPVCSAWRGHCQRIEILQLVLDVPRQFRNRLRAAHALFMVMLMCVLDCADGLNFILQTTEARRVRALVEGLRVGLS